MKRILALWLCVVAGMGSAAIRETGVFLTAVQAVGADSLVVLDLDNTVMESPQMLGSDQWFTHLVGSYVKNGMSRDAAVKQAAAQWETVQMATDMEPVEKATPSFIRGIQAMGTKVIALTARSSALAARTREQLARIGVDFSRSPIWASEMRMTFKTAEALYSEGILYAGMLDKGGVLAAFLDRIGAKPSEIVYVDDKKHHVESVGRAMKKVGLAFEGFRYGGADARVKAFDPEIADVQFRYFGRILSDDAATHIRMAE